MGERKAQLDKFYSGMKDINKIMPGQIAAFDTLLKAELSGGKLDFKAKEMICVALACYARCDYCIAYHVRSALGAGATPEELLEAAMVSVVFGGGPAMSYIATTLRECIDEFKTESKDE